MRCFYTVALYICSAPCNCVGSKPVLQRRICDSPRTMAEDLTPQSAVEARIASATIRLARVQLGLRKVQYPRHTDWIAALEGVERPMTATQILTVLLDSNDAPYQYNFQYLEI